MIMAGGAGTRLWPMSRAERPKQLLPLITPGSGRLTRSAASVKDAPARPLSLLEIAARRVDGLIPPERRMICTAEAFREQIRAALPAFSDDSILGEPVGRDTVNAVGLAAAVLAKKDKDLVPGAFWTAFGWGSYIYLSLNNPDAIGDLPRAEALMEFVVRHDSTYYYGGAHVFLGTLYGSRPKMLGGNVDLARRHFDAALRINGGKFLMTYVYLARSVAVQTLDETLFDESLAKVEHASIDILPEFRLANAFAKKKARLLMDRRADLF